MISVIGALIGGLTGYLLSVYMNKRNVHACTILCNKRVSILYFGMLGALVASSYIG